MVLFIVGCILKENREPISKGCIFVVCWWWSLPPLRPTRWCMEPLSSNSAIPYYSGTTSEGCVVHPSVQWVRAVWYTLQYSQ